MNLLVVGNGFDVAHDLKTQYTDFLNFLRVFDIIYTDKKNGPLKKKTYGEDPSVSDFLVRLINDSDEVSRSLVDELISLILS